MNTKENCIVCNEPYTDFRSVDNCKYAYCDECGWNNIVNNLSDIDFAWSCVSEEFYLH
jgi:hypothetical protein